MPALPSLYTRTDGNGTFSHHRILPAAFAGSARHESAPQLRSHNSGEVVERVARFGILPFPSPFSYMRLLTSTVNSSICLYQMINQIFLCARSFLSCNVCGGGSSHRLPLTGSQNIGSEFVNRPSSELVSTSLLRRYNTANLELGSRGSRYIDIHTVRKPADNKLVLRRRCRMFVGANSVEFAFLDVDSHLH